MQNMNAEPTFAEAWTEFRKSPWRVLALGLAVCLVLAMPMIGG